MSILSSFKRKRVPDLHKKLTMKEQLQEFYLTNQNLIGLLVIIICISILVFMIGYAFATGHIHALSSEANTYEHMEQIVLCTRMVMIKC